MEILATAFGKGSMHDFRLFKESHAGIAQDILCLADTGYLGIHNFHAIVRYLQNHQSFIR